MIITKSELQSLLENNTLEINFTKDNGSDRVLIGTLLPSLLPERHNITPSVLSEDLIRVYDLEKEGFRTVRISSLKSQRKL